MKKRKVAISLLYSLSQISAGLVIHPYQTMQDLVNNRVFIWMSFLPSFIWLFLKFTWFFFFFEQWFQHSLSPWLTFVVNVFSFYCLYWQLLLLYLLIRFWLAFKGDHQ